MTTKERHLQTLPCGAGQTSRNGGTLSGGVMTATLPATKITPARQGIATHCVQIKTRGEWSVMSGSHGDLLHAETWRGYASLHGDAARVVEVTGS